MVPKRRPPLSALLLRFSSLPRGAEAGTASPAWIGYTYLQHVQQRGLARVVEAEEEQFGVFV